MRIEDVVDLNEENVRRFLKYCKARPEDPADDALLAFCYVDEDGKIEPKTRTNLIEAAKVIEPMKSPNDPDLLKRFPKKG